jgi:hypothetical protein
LHRSCQRQKQAVAPAQIQPLMCCNLLRHWADALQQAKLLQAFDPILDVMNQFVCPVIHDQMPTPDHIFLRLID